MKVFAILSEQNQILAYDTEIGPLFDKADVLESEGIQVRIEAVDVEQIHDELNYSVDE
jgi:hypothetical protein